MTIIFTNFEFVGVFPDFIERKIKNVNDTCLSCKKCRGSKYYHDFSKI